MSEYRKKEAAAELAEAGVWMFAEAAADSVGLGSTMKLLHLLKDTNASLDEAENAEAPANILCVANGPASHVLFEIFRRRGATRIFGQYHTAQFIREPGGWKAVQDKLLLI